MRTLIQVELDTDTANKMITGGEFSEGFDKMMEMLKPEAAYFHPRGGRRGMTLVVDLPNEASIVTTLEPFWTQLGADVDMCPCMNVDELRAGVGRLTAG